MTGWEADVHANKEAMELHESKEGYVGRFAGRKGESWVIYLYNNIKKNQSYNF